MPRLASESDADPKTTDADPLTPAVRKYASVEAVKASALSVASALVIGAVPLSYTMFPGLANDSGFWRDQRLPVVLAWGAAVILLVHVITVRQERSQDSRHGTVIAIREAVGRAESAVDHIDDSLSRASGVLTETTTAIGRIAYNAMVAEASRSVAVALQQSLTALRLDRGSPVIPLDCQIMVHVPGGADSGDFLWPAYPPESLLDPTATAGDDLRRLQAEQVMQRVLQLARAWQNGDSHVVPVRQNDRQRLKGVLRRVEEAACCPIRDEEHRLIGLLTICSPSAARSAFVSDPGAAAPDLLDIAEDIAAATRQADAVIARRAGRA